MDKERRNREYNEYVEKITPKDSLILSCVRAFIGGGLICLIAQYINNYIINMGVDEMDSRLYTMIILILISVILTGLNIYSKLAKWCGAGTLVPITGFANSIASAAIEFKPEGEVFGKGTRIFVIAGPVILYGILASFLCGVVYYIMGLM